MKPLLRKQRACLESFLKMPLFSPKPANLDKQLRAKKNVEKWQDYAFRFLMLVAIPFIIGAFLLPHTQAMDGQLLSAPTENKRGTFSVVSYSFTHSADNISVPQQINAVFPLANYLDTYPFVSHGNPQICFEDRGSGVILPDGTEAVPDFAWFVYFNNDTVLTVAPSASNCTALPDGGGNTYRWVARFGRSITDIGLNETITFAPSTTAYPRVAMDYGLLQGLVLIPVAYLLVWYPAFGIIRKIQDGMAAQ
jgi:hypothetical protein